MYYDEDNYFETEYFDDMDYEEARLKDSAAIHRQTIINMEQRYGTTFPEFMLKAKTSTEMSDLLFWSMAVRFLAIHDEKIYS